MIYRDDFYAQQLAQLEDELRRGVHRGFNRRMVDGRWRRSGGSPRFDPMQLAPSFALRARAGVTEAGTGVSSWIERVLGTNFTQAVDANRPSYTASWRGGKPCLDFNGTSDRLNATLTADQLQGPNADTTVILYGELDTLAGAGPENSVIDFGGDRLWVLLEEGNAADMGVFDGAAYRALGQASTGAHSWIWSLGDGNGVANTATGYQDGVALGTAPYNGTGVGGSTYVGSIDTGGFYLDGKIADVLVFPRLLTTAELAQCVAYGRSEYALP